MGTPFYFYMMFLFIPALIADTILMAKGGVSREAARLKEVAGGLHSIMEPSLEKNGGLISHCDDCARISLAGTLDS
jgi:hypothetical protein